MDFFKKAIDEIDKTRRDIRRLLFFYYDIDYHNKIKQEFENMSFRHKKTWFLQENRYYWAIFPIFLSP